MATQTENLGLTKPDSAEGYDIAVFNNNSDAIDQFAGEMRNALGGSGGLSEKVDTLLDNVTAVKSDTEALVQALATANANIATLLTQTKGVKAIISGSVTVNDQNGQGAAVVPTSMNPDRVVVVTTSRGTSLGDNLTWTRTDRVINFIANDYKTIITYQLIEFY